MKYDPKSLYALNKADPNSIIYTGSNRRIIRLTRADFDSEADFLFWKSWSDENYHKKEKKDHIESDHTVPLEELPAGFVSEPFPEVLIERRMEREENNKVTEELAIRIRGRLTDKEFHRLWLNCVKGLTATEIASSEGKTHQTVSRSIRAAKKKILSFFRK